MSTNTNKNYLFVIKLIYEFSKYKCIFFSLMIIRVGVSELNETHTERVLVVK